MVGIKIGNKHSFYDYGLILSSKIINPPAAKKYTVDIAGGDGSIDYTDFFGETKFKNRTLEFQFTKIHHTQAEFIEDWSNFLNELNAQKVTITLDEDEDFYYEGRITLSYTRKKTITTISMKVDAEPYKLKHNNTVVSIQGSGNVVLNNLRKKVVPTIVTTAETGLVFGTSSFTLSAGTWVIPELELKSGSNTITVSGTGKTTFTYKEGGL